MLARGCGIQYQGDAQCVKDDIGRKKQRTIGKRVQVSNERKHTMQASPPLTWMVSAEHPTHLAHDPGTIAT